LLSENPARCRDFRRSVIKAPALLQVALAHHCEPTSRTSGARLAVLADALEEAGCTDAAILAHCRGGGEPARGCWVVDLLTGRQ
jgi:hypothetical protein